MLRIASVIYGLLLFSLTIASAPSDLNGDDTYAWTFINLAIETVACVGIFAMAIPSFRRPWMHGIWYWFGYALPVALTLIGIWEVRSMTPEPSLVESVAMLVAGTILLLPVYILNVMLRSRLTPAILAKPHAHG